MKRILCYGDSNTWGANAYSAARYKTAEQWPNVLAALYDGQCEIAQEGLGGRTAGDYGYGTEKPFYNGKPGYEIALRTALPVDYIVIGLGTNDLKAQYKRTADQIIADLLWYKKASQEYAVLRNWKAPVVIYLLIANYQGVDTSNRPPELRDAVNERMKQSGEPCVALDDLALSDDGLHWSVEAHKVVAERLKAIIDNMEEQR